MQTLHCPLNRRQHPGDSHKTAGRLPTRDDVVKQGKQLLVALRLDVKVALVGARRNLGRGGLYKISKRRFQDDR